MGLPTAMLKTVEGTTAYDWGRSSGLNWQAKKTKLHYFDEAGLGRESGKVSLIRDDTGMELGVVSPQYQIVQPQDILEGFESAVSNMGSDFKMDGIGVFGDGKVIWGRASSERSMNIAGHSLETYLYMLTSFDGSVSTMGFASTLRHVCCNAFHLGSQKRGESLFKLSHRSKYAGHAQKGLDQFMNQVDEFEQAGTRMSEILIKPQNVLPTMMKAIGQEKPVNDLTSREKSSLEKYLKAVVNSPGSTADREGASVWDVFNGITYTVDNDPIRKTKGHEQSAFMGAGDKLKAKAFSYLSLV